MWLSFKSPRGPEQEHAAIREDGKHQTSESRRTRVYCIILGALSFFPTSLDGFQEEERRARDHLKPTQQLAIQIQKILSCAFALYQLDLVPSQGWHGFERLRAEK